MNDDHSDHNTEAENQIISDIEKYGCSLALFEKDDYLQAFEGHPILYANHNVDGDWQFHTSDEPDLADSMLVSLSAITNLDPSINDIYHLQYGWSAWRNGPGEDWEFAEDEENEEE